MAAGAVGGGLLCPSAPSEIAEGQIFAVVLRGDEARNAVAYLNRTTPMREDLRLRSDLVSTEEVFRVAGPCGERRCRHFDGAHCGLAQRITELLAPSVDRLPRCAIRSSCRWWAEQRASACVRCPSIATLDMEPAPELVEAATPGE
jgi:hypothetical protein